MFTSFLSVVHSSRFRRRFSVGAIFTLLFLFLSLGSFAPARALSQPALVKTDASPAVYYVYNNQRYAFPNEKTFFTWYSNFLDVIIVSPAELASYPLVKNVTYRPNDRLLKIATDPKVYAVSRCGTLHWISTEALAIQLWGSQWNRLIDDIPDSFFSSYTVGSAYSKITDYLVDPTVRTIADNITCGMTTVAGGVVQGTTQGSTATTQSTTATTTQGANQGATASTTAQQGGAITQVSPTGTTQGSTGGTTTQGGSATTTQPVATITPVSAVVTPTGGVSKIGNCQIYPNDNPWNTDISNYPIHSMSGAWMQTVSEDFTKVHNAFNNPVGSRVTSAQPKVTIECTPGVKYCQNSDMYLNGSPRPMPIPLYAEIENINVTTGNFSGKGSDRHLFVVDTDACILYELFHAYRIRDSDGSSIDSNDPTYIAAQGSWHWRADSAGVYDLTTNVPPHAPKIPTDTVSGIPMWPGFVKEEEVIANSLHHAMMFALPRAQAAYVTPATSYLLGKQFISSTNYPPMGARMRMKASYDTSGFYGQGKVVAEAMKRYGLFLSDSGQSGIYPGGSESTTNSAWAYWPDLIQQLNSIPVTAFEFVDTGPLQY